MSSNSSKGGMEMLNLVDSLRITRYQLGAYTTGVSELDVFQKTSSGAIRADMLWIVDTGLIIRAIREALDATAHR